MWKRELDSFTPSFFCGIPQRKEGAARGFPLLSVYQAVPVVPNHLAQLLFAAPPEASWHRAFVPLSPTGVSGGLPQQLLFAFWCPEQTRGSSVLLQAPSAGAESVELSQNLPLKSASSPQRKQQQKLRLRELCFPSAVNPGGAVLQHRNEPVHARVHADKTRCKMLSRTCLKEAI